MKLLHRPMNVLVGCEFSGIVREAFRARGHNAWSCDLLPAADDSEYHIQCNVTRILSPSSDNTYYRGPKWDLAIFHPPCTYLCGSGLHWNKRVPGRAEKTEDALAFVTCLLNAPIPKIALENPRGCIGTRIRKADQSIQPYEFGHDASKETMLWLKNLPPLVKDPAQRVRGRIVTTSTGKQVERWANQTDSGQNRLGPSEDRWALRSETYPGIARAMAEQWG